MGLTAGLLSAALSAAIVLASDTTTQLEAPADDLAINAALYSLVSWGVDTIGGLLERLQEVSRTDSLTFEDAITCADRLMYSVKKGSKDAVAQQNF